MRNHSYGSGGRRSNGTLQRLESSHGRALEEVIEDRRHQTRNTKLEHRNEQIGIVIGPLGERCRQSRRRAHEVSQPGHNHIVHDRDDQAPKSLPEEYRNDEPSNPPARFPALGREGIHWLVHSFFHLYGDCYTLTNRAKGSHNGSRKNGADMSQPHPILFSDLISAERTVSLAR